MVIPNMFYPEYGGIVVTTEPKHVLKRLLNNILAIIVDTLVNCHGTGILSNGFTGKRLINGIKQ